MQPAQRAMRNLASITINQIAIGQYANQQYTKSVLELCNNLDNKIISKR